MGAGDEQEERWSDVGLVVTRGHAGSLVCADALGLAQHGRVNVNERILRGVAPLGEAARK